MNPMNDPVVKRILENPKILELTTPKQLRDILISEGYEVKPLNRGNFKGIDFEYGGGYKVNFDGNGLLSYHPEERSHHKGAYYKMGTAEKGVHRYDIDGNEIFD